MTQYIKVEGHDNLVRDKQTGAILNNDSSSYQAYMRQKQVKLSERNEIEKLKSEIEEKTSGLTNNKILEILT